MELSSLIHNKLNPRKISRERTEKLREYLGEYGDLSGVVYNSNPDCEALVSGHQRTSEFKRQKAKIVITERYESPQIDGTVARGFIENRSGQKYTYREVNWSKEKADAATIVANGQFGEWDSDILANSWDFDMPELRDFGVPEFVFGGDGMVGEGGIPNNALNSEAVEDDFEVPEINEVKTDIVLGDLFEIGPHRLLCGDSTDKADVERLMGGFKADMVFTDPPYGVDYTGGIQFSANGNVKKNQREKLENDDSEQIYADSIPIMASITNGPCYTWFADSKAGTIYNTIKKFGEIHALIIWLKNGGYGALNANYKQKHEPCLYWKPKNGKLNFCGATTETTIWEINKDGRNEFHPTQKPVALAAKAISNHNATSVADIFLGSGATMVAAHQLNRKCYGMEIDPKYCQVIVDRMLRLDPSLEIKRNGVPYKNDPKNSVKTV